MVKILDPALAFRTLNGLICVYKPVGVTLRHVQHIIVTKLCEGILFLRIFLIIYLF